MALTNAERQARWRERQKQAATPIAGLRAALSEALGEMELDPYDDEEFVEAADNAVGAMTDPELLEWFAGCVQELWDSKYVEAKKPSKRRKR